MDNLADELLEQIFNELEGDDLRKVHLVSKKFARIAAPIFYFDCCISRSDSEDQSQRIRQYLRTFCSNPNLGSFVHSLEVGPWYTTHPDGPAINPFTGNEVDSIARSAPWLTSVPFFNELQHSLLHGPSHDAMILAVLCLVPKVDRLKLEMKDLRYDPEGEEAPNGPINLDSNLVFRALEAFTTPEFLRENFLNRLTAVCLYKPASCEEYWDFRVASLFFNLPCLQSFSGRGMEDLGSDSQWECPVDGSNVEEVHLWDCAIGRTSIRNMLRSCRALKKLVCRSILGCCPEHKTGCDYSYDGISDDLSKHRSSLQKLSLFSTPYRNRKLEPKWDHGPIDSLVGFDNLRTLDIDQIALCGTANADNIILNEVLPANLEGVCYIAMKNTSQETLFRHIGDWILSKENPCTFHVVHAKFDDVDLVKEDMKGLVFERLVLHNDKIVMVRKKDS